MTKNAWLRRFTLLLAASILPACAELQDLQTQAASLVGQPAPPSPPPSAPAAEQDLSPVQRQLRTQAEALSTPVWKTATFWQATALGAVAGGVIAWTQHEDTEGIRQGRGGQRSGRRPGRRLCGEQAEGVCQP